MLECSGSRFRVNILGLGVSGYYWVRVRLGVVLGFRFWLGLEPDESRVFRGPEDCSWCPITQS